MPAPLLLDESHAEVRVEFAMARAEVALGAVAASQAEVMAAVAESVAEARQHPGLFVVDPCASDASQFAMRAVVAELAVRLAVSEAMIHGWVHQVEVMRERTPQCWGLFRDGELSAAHARIITELVAPLPPEMAAQFDAVAATLTGLPPARVRARLRTLAARLDSATLSERHARAASERRVWVEHTHDGMAWLTALLPAVDAHRVFTHLDRTAADLVSHPDETRTLAQARADVLVDLVAGTLGTPGATQVAVTVTVPVMTLLGLQDTPATLDGLHPIDADTARRLTAHAPSLTRLLTDPITGVPLTVDRGTYRVPADLKRWLRALHPTCVFPGCNRRARDCDLDHTRDHARGGPTTGTNLTPLCRHHHRIRHHTTWTLHLGTVHHYPGTITTRPTWTTPTGHTIHPEPPPPF